MGKADSLPSPARPRHINFLQTHLSFAGLDFLIYCDSKGAETYRGMTIAENDCTFLQELLVRWAGQ